MTQPFPLTYYSKEDLLEDTSKFSSETYVLSRKVNGETVYGCCRTPETYLHYLSDEKRYSSEVLVDRYNSPCWLYLEIQDKCDEDEKKKTKLCRVYYRRVMTMFELKEERGVMFGDTAHAFVCHKPDDFFMRIIINVKTTPAQAKSLLHMKLNRIKDVDKRIPWKTDIYEDFAEISTHRDGIPFVAFEGSDPSCATVRVMEEEIRNHLTPKLREKFNLAGDLEKELREENKDREKRKNRKKKTQDKKRKAVDIEPVVRARINASSLLDMFPQSCFVSQMISPDGLLESATEISPGTIRIILKHGTPCLFLDKPHDNNLGVLDVTNDSITYRCLSDACSCKSRKIS